MRNLSSAPILVAFKVSFKQFSEKQQPGTACVFPEASYRVPSHHNLEFVGKLVRHCPLTMEKQQPFNIWLQISIYTG